MGHAGIIIVVGGPADINSSMDAQPLEVSKQKGAKGLACLLALMDKKQVATTVVVTITAALKMVQEQQVRLCASIVSTFGCSNAAV